MIVRDLGIIPNDSSLISIQRELRSSLSEQHAPDELLLYSGGPLSDISQSSLLMGPPSHRTIFIQPENNQSSSINKNPLDGDLTFHTSSPLIVEHQEWKSSSWVTVETSTAESLSEAMRKTCGHECVQSPEGMPSLGSVTGILNYDLVQWTSPVGIKHIPSANSVLGIMYRISGYIFHNRSTNKIYLVADENHPWSNITDISLSTSAQAKSSLDGDEKPVTNSDNHHADKIRQIIESIRGGHLYQVNYGRTWRGNSQVHPWEIFERLDTTNPAPYSAWMNTPDLGLAIVSSSPELLLETDNKSIYTRPIKGTRPRGEGFEADQAEIMSLLKSRKEIAEHMMLVDLERNDVRKIAKLGTTHWSDWRVESFPNVHHLVSTIQGNYRQGLDCIDALQSLFPGGSITGCPKDATIASISWLEEEPRGSWTGSIGFIDPLTSHSIWNILIRTIEFHDESSTWFATIKSGGGITVESNPASEVDEAKLKASALIDACWPNTDPDSFRATITSPPSIQSIEPIDERTESLIDRLHSETIRNIKESTDREARVLFVDNLDSFTWNIVDELRICGAIVDVIPGRGQTTDFSVEEILREFRPSHIVLGPGPSTPENSPLTMSFASWALEHENPLPTLGLCLGHQALGVAAGWKLGRTSTGAVHGVPTRIQHVSSGLFVDLEPSPVMMRYHSLSLQEPKSTLSPILRSNAWLDPAGVVMGVEAVDRPVHGIQFHPESCGSPNGRLILQRFLSLNQDKFEDRNSMNQSRLNSRVEGDYTSTVE
ncbi:MAG: chorismate-binding protein [Candidatus Thermoplasmatota archaeon]|nr:chorismate-binding protein [Candidatus Thermoplasmatota archaeon]